LRRYSAARIRRNISNCTEWRDNHRIALDYSPGAPAINLVTDASLTGASETVTQGNDYKSAKVVVFWSGKLTATQQNYSVHELELLAIKESLVRFKHILQGVHFRILTDPKSLEYLMTQKNLSPRQTRWLETFKEFDYTIEYIPGETNVLADALSRMYGGEMNGTVRAEGEFVLDKEEDDKLAINNVGFDSDLPLTVPLSVGDEVSAVHEAALAPSKQPRDGPGKPGTDDITSEANADNADAAMGQPELPVAQMEGGVRTWAQTSSAIRT
jgi:hypothetical protein